jgi:predicted transcriptional regulator
MLDLLAAKGSVEILTFLKKQEKPVTISVINSYFQSQQTDIDLTTGTIYRRVTELQLAGFIMKNKDNTIFLTKFGDEKISDIQGKEIRLKRSPRDILNVIQEEPHISVQEIQQHGFSPVTIKKYVEELKELELVEEEKETHKKVGRPKKSFILTKKGVKALKKQEELEKELEK